MKRSIFLLIYSILYTAFPFLMVWSLFYINDIKAYDSNGMNWGFATFLALVLLTTLVMGITGCVLCWIAYRKNSLSLIQVSLLFMGTFIALYYPIPNQTFIPIGMFILGTVSYFDLRRILKMTT